MLLAIRRSEQLLSAAEKNCQGSIAANTKIAQGASPSVGSLGSAGRGRAPSAAHSPWDRRSAGSPLQVAYGLRRWRPQIWCGGASGLVVQRVVGGSSERQGLTGCWSAAQQAGHAQVLIEAGPVDAVASARECPCITFCRGGMQQAGIPGQGVGNRAPGRQRNHQRVVRAVHVGDAFAGVSQGTPDML